MLTIASLFKPLTDRLWAEWFKKCDDKHEMCIAALDCIRNEKHNFETIVARKPYGRDKYEPRARTQYSFENVRDATIELSQLPWFSNRRVRRIAAEISHICEQELSRPAAEREAAKVLELIEELEPLLVRRTRGMKSTNRDAVYF